ncbi:MAG: hypothetical protein AB8H47_01495 [Bacteroidia bacterium]
MKNIIFLFLLLLSAYSSQAQIRGAFGQVAGHFITNTEGNGFRDIELGLRTSVGLDIGEHISTGLKIQQIWYRGTNYDFQHMWMAGPFVRYGSSLENDVRFFGELGFMRGNYCTCSLFIGEYSKKEGVNYLAWGGGLEYQIRPGVYLNGELFFHYLLNQAQPKTGYHGYLLGLVFHLSRGNLSS